MKRKIVGVKDPILRTAAKPVTKIDKKIRELIADMEETLAAQKDPEGVGLAAPQVGKPLRLFVASYKNQQRVVINPEVLAISKEKIPAKTLKPKKKILEGCLSLPYYYGPIKRAHRIKIRYQNLRGEKITEEFTGFMAQIMAHEIDHLNGILFIDHVLEQKAPLYKSKGDTWEEVDLI